MNDSFYFEKHFNIQYGIGMSYTTVRAGDISPNLSILFVVMDQNANIIVYNKAKNKYSFIKGATASNLSVKLLNRRGYLATACSDQHLYFWKQGSGKKIKRFNHTDKVTNFLTDRKEKKCVSICHKGSVNIVNLDNMELIRFIENVTVSLWIGATFAYDFSTNKIFCNKPDRSHIFLKDLNTLRVNLVIKTSQQVETFLYLENTRKLSYSNQKILFVLNRTSLKCFLKLKQSESVSGSVYSMGHSYKEDLIFTGYSSGYIFVSSLVKKACIVKIKQESSVFFIRLTSHPRMMISCGEKSSALKVWDLDTTIKQLEGDQIHSIM